MAGEGPAPFHRPKDGGGWVGSMVRVVHVAPFFPPHVGGLQNHVDVLTREQARLGLEVTVVTSSIGDGTGEAVDALGRRIVRLPSLDLGADALSLGMLRRCSATKGTFDLVHLHGHLFLSTTVGALCRRLSHVPTLMTFHGDFEKLTAAGRAVKAIRDATQGPFILGGLDAIVALTRHDAGHLEAKGADPSRIVVIPNGVDLGTFRPSTAEAVAAFRGAYGVPDGARVVFFVGRMSEQKGLECLLRAVPLVLREHPDAYFVVAGMGHLLARYMHIARDLGLDRSLTFPGLLPGPDLVAAYGASELVAIPSLWEGMPLVALEAAASGRPVVATDVSGMSEFVVQGSTGMLVPPRSPEALASAIGEVLSDGAMASRMGRAALEKARSEFDLGTQVRRTVELYGRMVDGHAVQG